VPFSAAATRASRRIDRKAGRPRREHRDETGERLSDYAASWDGYAEAFNFASGSDRVRLTTPLAIFGSAQRVPQRPGPLGLAQDRVVVFVEDEGDVLDAAPSERVSARVVTQRASASSTRARTVSLSASF
jgi:hypothetical protein